MRKDDFTEMMTSMDLRPVYTGHQKGGKSNHKGNRPDVSQNGPQYDLYAKFKNRASTML
jgi:hypothetical protein